MAGGTKRIPRAVREQQMLDAALATFARRGFRDTTMDAIAAKAEISKPMLYLYYGSKDELFAAVVQREAAVLIEAMASGFDPDLKQHDQVRHVLVSLLTFVHTNRDAWRVVYREATGMAPFVDVVKAARAAIIEQIATMIRRGTADPQPGDDFELMALALTGAGEAVADRVADGSVDLDSAIVTIERLLWRGLAGKKDAR